MPLTQQFQNLFNPSTTLGAFIISLLSGIIGSLIVGFICGRKYQIRIQKKNKITAKSVGSISQDIRTKSELKDLDISKSNSIEVGAVVGEIKQDVEQ